MRISTPDYEQQLDELRGDVLSMKRDLDLVKDYRRQFINTDSLLRMIEDLRSHEFAEGGKRFSEVVTQIREQRDQLDRILKS